MFVDASAIVAILTREPEADAPADVLEGAHSPITSPIAIFEAAPRHLPQAARKRRGGPRGCARIPRDGRRSHGVGNREGGGDGARRILAVRERPRTSGSAQFGRLLCICGGEKPSDATAA